MADSLSGLGDISSIFRQEFTWSGRIESDFLLSRNLFSFKGTSQDLFLFSEDRPELFSATVQCHNKEEEYTLADFFCLHRGRWGKFWVPSPFTMFEIIGLHNIGALALTVQDNKFGKYFRGFERIYLLLKSGDIVTRLITGVSDGPDPGQITLQINEGLDRTINESDVEIFSTLLLCRFDIDKLEQNFITTTASEVNLRFQELVKEYPS